MTSHPGYSVSPEFSDYREDDATFFVVTSQIDAAQSALQAASERLYRVGDDGVEFPDEAAMSVAGDTVYTPNYVGDPVVRSDGVCIYLDTKGESAPPMLTTMVRVITEELQRAGVTQATIRPMTSADFD
jgi:hypothetical protein